MPTLTIPQTPGYLIKSITFTVASATDPDTTYTVSVNPLSGRPQSCTCPAAGFGRTCWHKKFVASGKAGKPRVRLMPKPDTSLVDSLYA